MPKKVTTEQRQAILQLLAQGQDRDTIAAALGVTPGQVSAVSAHVKMGTYALPDLLEATGDVVPYPSERTTSLLRQLEELERNKKEEKHLNPILLGTDIENGGEVYWNPDQVSGTPNPHILILGESGTGKTYAISCLTAELAQAGIISIVFDYGQGFSQNGLAVEFGDATNPLELHAGRDGVNINPMQIFPSDLHGPINVAQRVADTFARVYNIGIQQHAAIRQAVLDVLADAGILQNAPETWSAELPPFRELQNKLNDYAGNPENPQSRFAASAASHISTLFVFNTFRSGGQSLSWTDTLSGSNRVIVIQLKGLEYSLERAVTEFMLWNLIGFIEAMGPGSLRCFVVLDEAHKLSFDRGSPVEKLLREGRKFGLGLILASQQPEDFSPVAFANTATKIVFQVGDERSADFSAAAPQDQERSLFW